MRNIFLLTLLLCSLLPGAIYAGDNVAVEETEEVTAIPLDNGTVEQIQIDESTKKVTNKYFDLILEQKPQSAFNKSVPYVLTITPHIDSPKTQILWNVPSTMDVNPRHDEFVDLKNGETYVYRANVKPLREGTYDFSVSVISWQHDTNYTNSIDDTLILNEDLVLQPISTQYIVLNIVKYILLLGAFGGVCFVIVKASKGLGKKAKAWLTPPY